MVKTKQEAGLSPELLAQIKTVQKRHTTVDPGCPDLSLKQVINWHPIGGLSWTERSKLMKEAGIVDPGKLHLNTSLNFYIFLQYLYNPYHHEINTGHFLLQFLQLLNLQYFLL